VDALELRRVDLYATLRLASRHHPAAGCGNLARRKATLELVLGD
jgi:hypothetical protein